MIDLWSHKQAVKDVAAQLWAAVQRGESRWVQTVPGGGRHLVFKNLLQLGGHRLVGIEVLRPRELDAPTHLLVQLSRALGQALEPAPKVEAEADMLALLRARAKALALGGRALVLLLPLDWPTGADWPRLAEDASEEGQRARLRRLWAVVQGLRDSGANVVVISAPRANHPWSSVALRVPLERAVVGADAIRPDEVPAIADAAAAVQRALRRAGRSASPIQARVLVGLAALDVPADDLVRDPFEGLFTRFARELAREIGRRPGLAADVRCLALARHSLRRDRVATLLASSGRDAALLLDCVLYGDQDLRVPDPVRRTMLQEIPLPLDADASAHARLADYHRSLDGASSPATLAQAGAIEWLEKVHHLANGGRATAVEWSQQAKLDREHYWERARYLSKVAHQYGEAVALYRDCLERFGPDSYTHHYLGFNLDRAQAPLAEIRPHYEAAVELDPENPWWNTRLITFLIGHGTLREAEAAWSEALSRLDPDGERCEESPWLARHLHRWVIRRWLALGYVAEARAILDTIPRRWLEQEESLRLVEELVRDAEESLALGESVYPAGLPSDERWRGPRVTSALNGDGQQRVRWWPGRVVAAGDREVVVVLADPDTRTAFRVAYDADDWRHAADQPATAAGGFIEVAEYADGSRQVRTVHAEPAPSVDDQRRDVIDRLGPWPDP